MLDLLTTDEFAAWFRALADPAAEEVATALELIEKLGPERAVPHSRELLLWYQDLPPSGNDGRSYDAFFDFAARVYPLLEHLQSETLLAKLKESADAQAVLVNAAIRGIHDQVRSQRMHPRQGPARAESAWQAVRRHYAAATAAAAGVEEQTPPAHTAALRELSLHQAEPGMRVLYGVDVSRQRALLVLGEPLDRRAYGPSVRRALEVWQRFLDGPEGVDYAPAARSL